MRSPIFNHRWITSEPWKPAEDNLDEILNQSIDINPDISLEAALSNIKTSLHLPNRISKCVDHYIGKYLQKVNDHFGKDQVRSLCNLAEQQKLQLCRTFIKKCNCGKCEVLAESNAVPLPSSPCRIVQCLIQIGWKRFTNITPSYLYQVLSLSKKVDLHSPLMFMPESSSEIRLLIQDTSIMSLVKGMLESISFGLSPVLLGNKRVFPVNMELKNHLEAVVYQDGDGGFLNATYIPGLLPFVQKMGVNTNCIVIGRSTHVFIPFREAYHDAIELGHKYIFTKSNVEVSTKLGLDALASTRKMIFSSKETVILVHTLDRNGERILVEILTRVDSYDALVPNGLKLIEQGLSFASTLTSPVAPACYRGAERKACENFAGIWRDVDFHNIIRTDQIKPWQNKSLKPGQSTCIGNSTLKLRIVNSTEDLNQFNLMAQESSLPDAGMGLFIIPNKHTTKIIPEKTNICLYSQPFEGTQFNSTSDYLLQRECGDHFSFYDAQVFDGLNMGRFVNQGGLEQGLVQMCLESDKESGCSRTDWVRIKRVVQQYTNVKFVCSNSNLLISTTNTIHVPPGRAIELLVDYDIKEYWVKYILNNHTNLPSTLTSPVLWCAFSKFSTWEHSYIENLVDISLYHNREIMDKFSNKKCPYQRNKRRSLN